MLQGSPNKIVERCSSEETRDDEQKNREKKTEKESTPSNDHPLGETAFLVVTPLLIKTRKVCNSIEKRENISLEFGTNSVTKVKCQFQVNSFRGFQLNWIYIVS